MSDQEKMQLFMGCLMVLLGLSGWFLPYKYNLLRLKKLAARFLSEGANQVVPKVLGSILILVGIVAIIATLSGAKP